MSLISTPVPAPLLLTPANHALVLVDFQSQMAFATKSIDPIELRNNAGLVAHAAAGFKVPTVLTTVAEKSFSGPMFTEVTDPFPGQEGVRPMTSLQYLLELQRDWARTETYGLTTGIAGRMGGAYGIGIAYAATMFGAHEG